MSDTEWVSLQRAAEILGVHPATVRNWADRGDLPYRRTAGGHRRFRRADLEQVAHTDPLRGDEVQVILQNALGQMRMLLGGGTLAHAAWYERMSEHTRETMRTQGRRVLEALRGYLGMGAPDTELAHAITIGKDYAAALTADGLTLPDAVRGFFYFSDFVINAVLTWSELATPRSPAEWGTMLRHVNTFIHAMLLSIIEYYEAK